MDYHLRAYRRSLRGHRLPRDPQTMADPDDLPRIRAPRQGWADEKDTDGPQPKWSDHA